MFNPVPSRDEKRIFVLGGGAADVLMRYDAKSSQLKIPFTWVRPSGWVSFSRDGQVAYCLGPQFGLWRSRTDGTDRLALTPPNLMAGRPAWSPDGSRIAFQAERKGELSKIYWIPAKGGASEPAPQTVGNQREPDWSPDGKYVMFNVQPEKGLVSVEQSGVFHWDLSSSEITKLPGSENLIGARWSPNGRFIAAIDFEQTKLLIYDAADRAWKELAKGSLLGDPVWSPDGKYIYIQDVLKEEEPVYRLRLADQHRESLPGCDVALREGMQRCIFLGLAPDGSLLLNLRQSFFNVYALDFESGK